MHAYFSTNKKDQMFRNLFLFFQYPYIFALLLSLSPISLVIRQSGSSVVIYGPFHLDSRRDVSRYCLVSPSHIRIYITLSAGLLLSVSISAFTVRLFGVDAVSEKPSSSPNFNFLILAIVFDFLSLPFSLHISSSSQVFQSLKWYPRFPANDRREL